MANNIGKITQIIGAVLDIINKLCDEKGYNTFHHNLERHKNRSEYGSFLILPYASQKRFYHSNFLSAAEFCGALILFFHICL